MKNFYYEKCRKPRYRKGSPIGWPINRFKVGIRYHHKKPRRWRDSDSMCMYKRISQVITACKTEFILNVTHPHNTTYGGSNPNQTIQCIPNVSLAQMDAIVERYSKRNPSYQFDYDPSQVHVTFYGRHHNYLGHDRSKQIFYPCQKFGSSRYVQFRRFKFKTINRTHKETSPGLPF